MITNNVVLGNNNDDIAPSQEQVIGPVACNLPWCRGHQGGAGEEIRRVKKRPGPNNKWDCACDSCGTGPEGIDNQKTVHNTQTNCKCKAQTLTNVVVGTRLTLLRRSRRDQAVQARRDVPVMPVMAMEGVVPLEDQEEDHTPMDVEES